MCKLIAELVGSDEQIVREMITRLERTTGQPGIDVRLTGEVFGSARMKLRGLGLDPRDTTTEELYHGLQSITALHDQFLAQHFGLASNANSSDILERSVHVLNRLQLHRQTWLLKSSVAKRLLSKNAPKQLQKMLRYRSVDSLLKREPIDVLMNLAQYTESTAWKERLYHQYKKLTPSDFEIRDIQIHYLDANRWAAISQIITSQHRTHTITSLEMGSICVLPVPINRIKGLTLLSILLVLRAMNDIRLHSTFFKFHHVQPRFGELIVDTLTGKKQDHVRLAGQPVHWRVVHTYYGDSERYKHPEIFQPHIQPEDLAYRKAEAILYRLEPALHFWHNLDYVGLPQLDGPISFNLVDNAINLVNQLPYQQRVSYHLRDALWNELYCRYLGQNALERQLLHQLDERVVAAADIPMDLEFVL